MSTVDDRQVTQLGMTHEDELRRRIEYEPENSELWYYLGLHLMSGSRVSEAIEVLERAARLDNKDFRVWGSLALLYRDSGDVPSAESAWFRMQDILVRCKG